jgi:glycosyltransferase involved in cell wall biosynthesis
MVMPSLIGPTNIPPWEAFKMKTPAIYSELEGIKDVLGNAVYYIDPLDPNSIANGIKEIYENKELNNNLIISGKKKLDEIKARNEFGQFFEIIKQFRKIKRIWEFNN